MPPQPIDPQGVFLNIPYDEEFRTLYLAYIVGLCCLGFIPHIAAEIPGGARRLDRILTLIKSCRFSVHDLSRVELSVSPNSTPRFNMPLELGMTITWASIHPKRHAFFVFEAEPYRLQRSTSDLNGTDVCIHNGNAEGVLSELRGAFWRADAPTVPQMMRAHRFIAKSLESILNKNGTRHLFMTSVFHDLCRLSTSISEQLRHGAGS